MTDEGPCTACSTEYCSEHRPPHKDYTEAEKIAWRDRIKAERRRIHGMAKRGYSREFTPQTDRRVRFEIDRIPPTLYDAVKAKAKREGVSLRTLTLRLWRAWIVDAPDSGTR